MTHSAPLALLFLLRTWWRMLLPILLLAGLALPSVRAEGIVVTSAQLELDSEADSGWVLAADFDISLTPRVQEAVSRGVTLYFVIDFELHRARWYWWDQQTARASQTWRLSYHALTRQYRLSQEGLQLRFNTLEEALRSLTRSRNWRVVEKEKVGLGNQYEAQVRMRLDTTLLAKPLQFNAITSSDWSLSSNWKRFGFVPQLPEKPSEPK